jgi:hypothetical protein
MAFLRSVGPVAAALVAAGGQFTRLAAMPDRRGVIGEKHSCLPGSKLTGRRHVADVFLESGVDPLTGGTVPLFDPRLDRLFDHFRFQGPVIEGTTPVGARPSRGSSRGIIPNRNCEIQDPPLGHLKRQAFSNMANSAGRLQVKVQDSACPDALR